MTKLLFLSSNLVGKGTYWRALGFGKELAKRGYDITLLAISQDKKFQFVERLVNGVRLIETPDLFPRSGYDPWGTFLRISFLRHKSFDLIHAFESRPVVIGPALYVQKQQRIPLIMDWCDWFGQGGSVEERANPIVRTILRPIETFFEERFRCQANGTTVINTLLQQKARSLGIPQEQILMLPNGADISNTHPQDKHRLRQKLGLPKTASIIAYTGSMFQADAQLMAASFNRIIQHNPATRLLLVGYTNVAVEKLVNNPDNVIRTGKVTYAQLRDYVIASDLGWLPLSNIGANRGRFPMKLNDFMSAERPVMVTNVGDLGSIVQKYDIGRVSIDTPESVAQVTLNLLQDTAVMDELGKKARNIAETVYAWPVVTQKLHHYYQKILHGN